MPTTARASQFIPSTGADQGTYNLSGTGYLTGPNLSVGGGGPGTFNESGGNAVLPGVSIDNGSGALGTYNLSTKTDRCLGHVQ